MFRSHSSACLSLVLAAGLMPAYATSSSTVGTHHSSAHSSAALNGWRDGGRIANVRDGTSLVAMDSSLSHVLVAAVTTIPGAGKPLVTTLARRSPLGRWNRQVTQIGGPVAVDVNAHGDAVIVSVRTTFDATGEVSALLATTWHRGLAPRTKVILPASDAPQYFDAHVSANGRGDIAVLVTPTLTGGAAKLLRKPLGKPWKRTLSVRPAKYSGILDSIDLTSAGLVVGAFKQDQVLSVRRLPMNSNTFRRATEVTTWPAINDVPHSYDKSRTQVKVGPNGDLATAWSYDSPPSGGSQVSTTRITIVPASGTKWQREFERADSIFRLAKVAADGSVLIQDGSQPRRWQGSTRSFRGPDGVLKDVDERGDVLVGSSYYSGTLRVWPVGKAPQPQVQTMPGRQLAWVLTNDHTAYVAVGLPKDSPTAFYLRIRPL